jgi:hypothetical protein
MQFRRFSFSEGGHFGYGKHKRVLLLILWLVGLGGKRMHISTRPRY